MELNLYEARKGNDKFFSIGSLIGNTKGERNAQVSHRAHQMAIEKANVILECFRLNISLDKKV